MSTQSQSPTTPKAMFWAGWVITILPVLGLIMSATMKFIQPAELVDGFKKFGYDLSVAKPLGAIELVCTILYLIAQTAVLGAILLTGYLGGAVATHVRINDDFTAPVIMGVMLWAGLYLRDARIRALLPFRR